MEITLYRDETAFELLRSDWNRLLADSRADTIFLTWEWQSTWWKYVGASRGPLYVLALRDQGRLAAIIPLYLTTDGSERTLQVVGCIEVSDYLDLIVDSGREEAVYAAFLEWLSNGEGVPAWDLLDLCNQPAGSLAHTVLPEMARALGWRADVLQEDVCPIIDLPSTCQSPDCRDGWEEYLCRLDKKQRHEVRRKLRRLERESPGAEVRIVTGGPQLEDAVDQFIRLHKLSTPEKEDFMTGEMQAFFHGIAQVLAQLGWLQISFLDIRGQPAASYFCFDYANEILVYNSGYDPKSSPQLSPGWVLLARLVERAIAQRRQRFDFLQGDEEYKHRFGGVDHPVYRTLLRRS